MTLRSTVLLRQALIMKNVLKTILAFLEMSWSLPSPQNTSFFLLLLSLRICKTMQKKLLLLRWALKPSLKSMISKTHGFDHFWNSDLQEEKGLTLYSNRIHASIETRSINFEIQSQIHKTCSLLHG